MKSKLTRDFRKRFGQLPHSVQKQAKKTYLLWQDNPYHPSLQFKSVNPNQPIYSVRIGINYRALGLLENGEIYWFWIGTHAEYDEFLKRL